MNHAQLNQEVRVNDKGMLRVGIIKGIRVSYLNEVNYDVYIPDIDATLVFKEESIKYEADPHEVKREEKVVLGQRAKIREATVLKYVKATEGKKFDPKHYFASTDIKMGHFEALVDLEQYKAIVKDKQKNIYRVADELPEDLADLLGTRAGRREYRVLRYLYEQRPKSFHYEHLENETGTHIGVVESVEDLYRAGLIENYPAFDIRQGMNELLQVLISAKAEVDYERNREYLPHYRITAKGIRFIEQQEAP